MPRHDNLLALLPDDVRDDRAISLIEGEGERRELDFRQLRRRAVGLLGALQRRGLRRGDTLILAPGDNERFLETFWACVLGGIVPAPLASGGSDEHGLKLLRVFGQLDAAAACLDPRTLDKLDGVAAAHGLQAAAARLRARAFVPGGLDAAGAPGTPAVVGGGDLAFIQYSSGSTGEPKGVLLTHANVTANIASIIEAAAFTDRDVALSWMPLSHDMGLIGFHLNMLAAGVSHAVMRTELFARRPLLWLDEASRRRSTILCSPNFGYQHYLSQFAKKPPTGLDLSAVRLVFNGAEPISAALCRRFTAALAPHGLAPNSMFPVYGLAEASLAVSFPRPGAPLATVALDRAGLELGQPVRVASGPAGTAAEFVALGTPVPGTEVRIADDAGGALGESVLGRVLIRGANVTAGYFGAPADTAVPSADGWLDTGDLGCVVAGQLVITGRAKDLVFVNGQNVFPHDLERLAEQVPGIETNRVVAAGVRRGADETESLAIFIHQRGDLAEFADKASAVRRVLNQQAGLAVAHVVPVGRIPKTTSGKLQRFALARAFEAGEFDAAIAELAPFMAPALADAEAGEPPVSPGEPPAAVTVTRLLALCVEVFPERPVTAETNLLEINLSSLALARLHEAIDREFPGRVEVTDLFDYPTLAQLAAFLDGPERPV